MSRYRSEAERLRRSGALDKAVEAYRAHLASDPRDAEARERLADLLQRLGNKDGAISEYVKVQEIRAAEGDILAAIEAGLKVVRLDPRFDNPLSYVAKVQTDSLREEKMRRDAATVPAVGRPPVAEIPLLSELAPDELAAVAETMRVVEMAPGGIVFREGEPAESLFFVSRGKVEVLSGPRKLGELGPGEIFGEFSFLTRQPRTATVRAIEEATLLELDATSMKKVVLAHPRLEDVLYKMYRERAMANVLARSPLFEMLDADDRERIAGRFELVRVPAGEAIVRQGERGGAIYLVKSGTVEVRTVTREGDEVVLARLGPHTFFGEVSFLTGVPRTATVTALEDAELLRLEGEELARLESAYPELEAVLRKYHLDRVLATAETLKAFLRQERVAGILH